MGTSDARVSATEAATAGEPMRSAMRARIARHPLVVYVLVAYVLSWAYWVPLAMGSRTTEYGVGWPTQMPGLVGPAFAAVIVTALVDGRAGLADLWRRLTRWRVGLWWLSVLAILTVGAIGLAATGSVGEPGDLTAYLGISGAIGPLGTVVVVFVVNGVGEELGWRGLLVDRLLPRHGLTITALLVALVWAPWHIPLFFFNFSLEDFGVAGVAGWTIGLTAGSIVLTWLYRASGASVLLVAVWHTAYNFTSATPATHGAVAAISSTTVMIAAVVIVVFERRSGTGRRAGPTNEG